MRERILGLDIGTDCVKAIQITTGMKKQARITGSGTVNIREAGGLAPALVKLREELDLDADICVTMLAAGNFAFRNIPLPFKDQKKIRQVIAFELEPLLPWPIEDVEIDFLSVDKEGPAEVLAAVALRSVLKEHIRTVEEAFPEASIIEVGPVPQALILAATARAEGFTGSAIVLDIGCRESAGALLEAGRIRLIRTFAFGGETLTGIISDKMKIEAQDAEDRKLAGDCGLAGHELDKACAEFASEVKGTLELVGAGAPERLFLTGGGSLYPGVSRELALAFGISTSKISYPDFSTGAVGGAEQNIVPDGRPVSARNPQIMNGALALALRAARKGVGFNFRRGAFELDKSRDKWKNDLRWAAAMALAGIVALCTDQVLGYYLDYVRLGRIKAEINSIFKASCPEVTRIVDPIQQLKSKITDARKISLGGSRMMFLEYLKEISELAPQSAGLLITNLAYDDEHIDMKGEAASFDKAEEIKRALAGSPLFRNVTINSANMSKQGAKVEFGIKMDVVRK